MLKRFLKIEETSGKGGLFKQERDKEMAGWLASWGLTEIHLRT